MKTRWGNEDYGPIKLPGILIWVFCHLEPYVVARGHEIVQVLNKARIALEHLHNLRQGFKKKI